MQSLRDTLSEMLPEITLEGRSNQKQLEKQTKKLMTLVHSLGIQPGGESVLPPDSDPTIPLLQSMFEREIKRAHSSLRAGNVAYAKSILRTTTQYCISCHTRTNSGPDFPSLNLSPKTDKLSLYDRAQLLAATRQFDAALESFSSVISNPTLAKKNPIEWERAIRTSLALAIRVKRDPNAALQIVKKVQSSPQSPEFLKMYAAQWATSLEKWKGEPTKAASEAEAHFVEASRLFLEAKTLQDYPSDHAGDVELHLATAEVHDYLQRAPNGKNAAEAFLIAGMAYEILNDMSISPLHELYYESCIRKTPHSMVANRCYRAYESSIYFGYSGSGGTSIPSDVQKTLDELKALAKVK